MDGRHNPFRVDRIRLTGRLPVFRPSGLVFYAREQDCSLFSAPRSLRSFRESRNTAVSSPSRARRASAGFGNRWKAGCGTREKARRGTGCPTAPLVTPDGKKILGEGPAEDAVRAP